MASSLKKAQMSPLPRGETVHAGRFSLAAKTLRIREAHKAEMYSPIGVFAGAVLDPDTGKCLEY